LDAVRVYQTTPGTVSIPPGVSEITIEIWGAGGASGQYGPLNAPQGLTTACSGGGGGAYAMATYNVTGVTQLTITVGAGATQHDGGTTTVMDVGPPSGHRINMTAVGGRRGIACEANSETSFGTTRSIAGGVSTAPLGSNLQPGSSVHVHGGSTVNAVGLLLGDDAGGTVGTTWSMLGLGSAGGSAFGSGPGGVGANAFHSFGSGKNNAIVVPGGTNPNPGSGAGGCGANCDLTAGTCVNFECPSVAGANGMVRIWY
jgi:hypothetical protein